MDNIYSSEVYNPSYEPHVTELYNLMIEEQLEESLLDTYRDAVWGMTTANPYRGVLTNPLNCDIDAAIHDLNEQLVATRTSDDTPDWYPLSLAESIVVLDEFKDHTDRLIANFSAIQGIVQQQIGSTIQELSGNPCIAFGDVMGSIMGAGDDLINEILASIAALKNNPDGQEELLKTLTDRLMAAIAAAKTKMLEEVDRIAMGILNMERMNLAQMLKHQNEDACVKYILGKVMTKQAAKIIENTEE